MSLKISVLVPTWKRPDRLRACLESLSLQTRQADEILVSFRRIDTASLPVLEEWSHKINLKLCEVEIPGVIAAENALINLASGDIFAFLDDDATAPIDWLKKIEGHFSNLEIGAVGGQDYVILAEPGHRRVEQVVGEITWYGKIIGNHHHQVEGGLRQVKVLKGVNMAFRRSGVCLLDETLQSEHNKGNGSHWELDLCFNARKRGLKLFFDPSLEVVHYSNHDHFLPIPNLVNNARNMSYVMFKNLPWWQKEIFFWYITLVGNSQIWGILKMLKEFPRNPIHALQTWILCQKSFYLGMGLWLQTLIFGRSK